MSNMYYFEVPYTCTCEVCGKKFDGIIKRGPLQIGSSVLSTGMQAGVNSTEMKFSKSLIESDINSGRKRYFTTDNNSKCLYCNSRQSWDPITPPVKPSYIGLYIAALIFFPLIAMAIWAIFFFDAIIPFVVLEGIAVFFAIYLPYRSQKKNLKGEMEQYEKLNKEYVACKEEIKNRKTHNKPEIDWSKAVHIPAGF